MKKIVGKVYPRTFDQWYYVKVNGKAKRLCPISDGVDKAWELRDKLVEDVKFSATESQACLDNELVYLLIDRFIEQGMTDKTKKTIENNSRVLHHFGLKFGLVKYCNLNCQVVLDWVKSLPNLTDGGKFCWCKCIKAWANYWYTRDKVTTHKFKQLKHVQGKPRGEEFSFPKATHEKIMFRSPQWLQDILEFMWLTGCRPGECLTALGSEINYKLCVLDKIDHKTKKKGCSRRIGLTTSAMALLARLKEKRGDGLLFLGRDSRPVHENYLIKAVRRAATKAGFTMAELKYIIPYSWRHSCAVRWIENPDLSEFEVAARLGHKGTAILHKNYSHALERVYKTSDKFAACE